MPPCISPQTRQLSSPARPWSSMVAGPQNRTISIYNLFFLQTQKGALLMALDYGVMVPQGWRMDLVDIPDPIEAYEAMTRVAHEAQALGYHSIWLYDHFHTVPTPTQQVTFECLTSTSALARDTKRVRIDRSATGNSQ